MSFSKFFLFLLTLVITSKIAFAKPIRMPAPRPLPPPSEISELKIGQHLTQISPYVGFMAGNGVQIEHQCHLALLHVLHGPKLWNLSTHKEKKRPRLDNYDIESATLSPQGKLAIGQSEFNRVTVLNTADGKEIDSFEFETESDKREVREVVFSPNERYLVAMSYHGESLIRDIEKKETVCKFDVGNFACGAAFSLDSKHVFAGTRGAALWSLSSTKKNGNLMIQVRGQTQNGEARIMSPPLIGENSPLLIALHGNGKRLSVFDRSKKPKLLETLDIESYLLDIFSGKKAFVASIDRDLKIYEYFPSNGKFKSRDLEKTDISAWTSLNLIEPHGWVIASVHNWDNNGRKADERKFLIWDITTGKLLKEFQIPVDFYMKDDAISAEIENVSYSEADRNGLHIFINDGRLYRLDLTSLGI